MENRYFEPIELRPIGHVSRICPGEDDRDRSIVTKVVINEDLTPALERIDEWSHLYVIFWMERARSMKETILHHSSHDVGIFATRAPIHPNPIGLTLVELIKREKNVLWVRGLDAYDGTPVLDIKPYPDWEKGRFIVVTDFRSPEWLERIMKRQERK